MFLGNGKTTAARSSQKIMSLWHRAAGCLHRPCKASLPFEKWGWPAAGTKLAAIISWRRSIHSSSLSSIIAAARGQLGSRRPRRGWKLACLAQLLGHSPVAEQVPRTPFDTLPSEDALDPPKRAYIKKGYRPRSLVQNTATRSARTVKPPLRFADEVRTEYFLKNSPILVKFLLCSFF